MPALKKLVIADADADILRRGSWENDLYTLPGQLDRRDYIRINKVLETLGGKWNRGRKGHVFPSADREALRTALQQGFVVDQKRSLGQFDTPDDIADRVVEAIEFPWGEDPIRLLEPSAGQGSLLWAVRRALADRTEMIDAHAVELDEVRAKDLREHVAPALLRDASPFRNLSVERADFLEWSRPEEYQVIVANPPFGNGEDTKHVSRMLDFLAPGGMLSVVMAGSMSFRQDRKYRDLQDKLNSCADWRLEDLPEQAFASSGTQVTTVLLVARKQP